MQYMRILRRTKNNNNNGLRSHVLLFDTIIHVFVCVCVFYTFLFLLLFTVFHSLFPSGWEGRTFINILSQTVSQSVGIFLSTQKTNICAFCWVCIVYFITFAPISCHCCCFNSPSANGSICKCWTIWITRILFDTVLQFDHVTYTAVNPCQIDEI